MVDVCFEKADGVPAAKRFINLLANTEHFGGYVDEVHRDYFQVNSFTGMYAGAIAKVEDCEAGANRPVRS